jgi:hypothetical protein
VNETTKLLLIGASFRCTPSPVVPPNDSGDAMTPDAGPPLEAAPARDSSTPDASSYEQIVCDDLAAHGCDAGANPQCVAVLQHGTVNGGYLSPWIACVLNGGGYAHCGCD